MGLEGPLAGVGFGVGEGEACPSASLIKVLVLVELLRQADSGLASLEEGGRHPIRRPGRRLRDA